MKSTGEFTRSTAPGEFGDDVKTQIFSRKANDLLGPLDTTGGVVLLKVIKRGPETADDIARVKAGLRAQLLEKKRGEAFMALLGRLQRAASIEYNKEALEQRARRASR